MKLSVIRAQWRQMRHGYGVKIAVGTALILAAWEWIVVTLPASTINVDELDTNSVWIVPYNLWSNWLGGEMLSLPSYLYRLLLPILSALPFAASYATDMKGYHVHMLSRSDKKSYLKSKIFTVWCSGGFAAVLPLLFSFLSAMTILPLRGPDRTSLNLVGSKQIFGDFFAETPLLYLSLWSFVIFAFCGAMALIALFVSLYVKNPFLITITPFTLYLGADVVARRMDPIHADAYLPMQFLHPQQWMPGRPDIVFTELGILLVFGVLFYVIALRRDVI